MFIPCQLLVLAVPHFPLVSAFCVCARACLTGAHRCSINAPTGVHHISAFKKHTHKRVLCGVNVEQRVKRENVLSVSVLLQMMPGIQPESSRYIPETSRKIL